MGGNLVLEWIDERLSVVVIFGLLIFGRWEKGFSLLVYVDVFFLGVVWLFVCLN